MAGGTLVKESANVVLCRLRHNNVAERLDCVGKATLVVAIVLAPEGRSAQPHRGFRLAGKFGRQRERCRLDMAIGDDFADQSQPKCLLGIECAAAEQQFEGAMTANNAR